MTFLNRHLKRHRAMSLCTFLLVAGVSTAQQDLQMSLTALSPLSISSAGSIVFVTFSSSVTSTSSSFGLPFLRDSDFVALARAPFIAGNLKFLGLDL